MLVDPQYLNHHHQVGHLYTAPVIYYDNDPLLRWSPASTLKVINYNVHPLHPLSIRAPFFLQLRYPSCSISSSVHRHSTVEKVKTTLTAREETDKQRQQDKRATDKIIDIAHQSNWPQPNDSTHVGTDVSAWTRVNTPQRSNSRRHRRIHLNSTELLHWPFRGFRILITIIWRSIHPEGIYIRRANIHRADPREGAIHTEVKIYEG